MGDKVSSGPSNIFPQNHCASCWLVPGLLPEQAGRTGKDRILASCFKTLANLLQILEYGFTPTLFYEFLKSETFLSADSVDTISGQTKGHSRKSQISLWLSHREN